MPFIEFVPVMLAVVEHTLAQGEDEVGDFALFDAADLVIDRVRRAECPDHPGWPCSAPAASHAGDHHSAVLSHHQQQ
jgi:hypothetical protein